MSTEEEDGIAEIRKERDALRRQVREHAAEIERLKPFEAQTTDLSTQVSTLSGELEGLRKTHSADVRLARMGFDDAGAIAAKAIHGAQSDAPPFEDWLDSLTPDTAPRALRAYLDTGTPSAAPPAQPAAAEPAPTPAEPSSTPAAAAAPAAPPTPRPGGNADPATPSGAAVSADALALARTRLRENPGSTAAREHLEGLVKASRAMGADA